MMISITDLYIRMLTLTEKELGHALFYTFKRGDMDHADYLLSIDAPTDTSYFLSQDKIAYTQSTIFLR